MRITSGPDYRAGAIANGLRVLWGFSERRPVWRLTGIAETSLPLPAACRIALKTALA